MASFQAQIGWKRQRKRENKNCHSVPLRSYPSRNRKLQKIAKNSKIPLWLHFKPNWVVKCREREKIKILSWHYGILSSQNRLEKAKKERK